MPGNLIKHDLYIDTYLCMYTYTEHLSSTKSQHYSEQKFSYDSWGLAWYSMLLLLLLSRFSHVQLCATPQTAAHQAPPSLGFSRQEHWSGLPFPSPMHESEKWKWSLSVMSDSSQSHDCSLPGSSIHGIFQARVLEWGAIALSGYSMQNRYLINVYWCSLRQHIY